MAVRRTHAGAATAMLLVALTGCAEPTAKAGPSMTEPSTSTATTPAADTPELPDGWRWESFGGIQVGVPGDFGWGNGEQRLGQWCIEKDRDPIVGRPGASTAVGCPMEGDVDPGTLLENTGPVVAFGTAALWGETETPADGRRTEGDRLTVTHDGVAVRVQAEPELREQIAATIHSVEVDAYGCPVTSPYSAEPGRAPEDPVAVETLTDVTAVSACRYAVTAPGGYPPGAATLLSSLRLDGADAAAAVQEIAAAPVGGGPNAPETCAVDYSHGDDLIVLLVESDQGGSEVVMRYSGCDHNGFDDGVTVRALTAEAVAPIIAGPNRLTSISGPQVKADMFFPR